MARFLECWPLISIVFGRILIASVVELIALEPRWRS